LILLHLKPHVLKLLSLHPESLQKRLTRLLVAAESTETSSIGMLLTTVDAECHDVPSITIQR